MNALPIIQTHRVRVALFPQFKKAKKQNMAIAFLVLLFGINLWICSLMWRDIQAREKNWEEYCRRKFK
jgi:hypothetical protein